uniref:Putative secreted protein n=1 Tax=Ixodes ricinus TaxID=34613 RepID=A0A6B0UA11_IXORI
MTPIHPPIQLLLLSSVLVHCQSLHTPPQEAGPTTIPLATPTTPRPHFFTKTRTKHILLLPTEKIYTRRLPRKIISKPSLSRRVMTILQSTRPFRNIVISRKRLNKML